MPKKGRAMRENFFVTRNNYRGDKLANKAKGVFDIFTFQGCRSFLFLLLMLQKTFTVPTSLSNRTTKQETRARPEQAL